MLISRLCQKRNNFTIIHGNNDLNTYHDNITQSSLNAKFTFLNMKIESQFCMKIVFSDRVKDQNKSLCVMLR